MTTFIGRIESISGGIAKVTLAESTTMLEAAILQLSGLKVGDEFQMDITKLEPKPISIERAAEILARYKDRWDF